MTITLQADHTYRTRRRQTIAANSPNAIDPDLADKLAELDRTDPIDVLVLASDGTAQTFEGVGALISEAVPENLELVDSWKDHVPEDFDPATHVPMHERTDQPIEETHATNPYLLESSTVLGDFHSEAQRAQLLINQIDHEIEHLTQDADFQIQRIVIRRDAELSQRERRKADLMKIVAAAFMIGGKEQADGE